MATETFVVPAVDPETASEQLSILHGNSPGFIGIIMLNPRKKFKEQSAFFERIDLVDTGNFVAARAGLQEFVDEGWDMYVGCSTLKERPERKQRGSHNDVLSVPGVWADLDVKPGVNATFQNEQELLQYIRNLGVAPTMEIATGSGGRHLYWLLKNTEPMLDSDSGAKLLSRWYDFLTFQAGGISIDNVHDTTRILRLAGTVRFPKNKDYENVHVPRQVKMIHSNGPRYSIAELEFISQTAFIEQSNVRNIERKRRKEREKQERAALDQYSERAVREWHLVKDEFNRRQDWQVLLLRSGWTLFSDERDKSARCRRWTRPGKNISDGKSASTDFIGSDGITSSVMTIYSQDDALADLCDGLNEHQQIICSKYNYALKRLFDGDENSLLDAISAGNGILT